VSQANRLRARPFHVDSEGGPPRQAVLHLPGTELSRLTPRCTTCPIERGAVDREGGAS
jgi:arginine deiminase